jgi:hypothetical protein
MKTIGVFLAGVATGWVLRSTFGSFRGLAVSAVAGGHDMAARARRFVAVEREFFEDLMAEGRARFEEGRARVTVVPAAPQATQPKAYA